MTASVPKERPLARDVGLLVAGAVIAFLINQYGGELLRSLQASPPSRAAQLATIEREGASVGLYPVVRRADLHGDGAESIIVESIFAYTLPGDNASKPQSDQIAIYDVHPEGGGTRLAKRFSFSPRGVGGIVNTPSWRLSQLSILDIAHDGRQEIVGAFSEDRADNSDVRPFLISWDPVARRYSIAALLPRATPFTVIPGLTERERYDRVQYASGSTLTDPRTHITIRAYGTSRFAVAKASVIPATRFSPALLVTMEGAATERSLSREVQRRRFAVELDVYSIDARTVPPGLSFCGSTRAVSDGFPESGSSAIVGLLRQAPPEAFGPACQ
jgi:hypothetical protein